MTKSNLARELYSQDDDSADIAIPTNLSDYKRAKLLKLQHKLKRLREELTTNMLQQIKQCRSSFEDANRIAGELNDSLKTRS
jgi:hypothetical protein